MARSLQEQVVDLVREHGLPAVYRAVRDMDGFCGNCGCPKVAGEVHNAGGLGNCWISTPKATRDG